MTAGSVQVRLDLESVDDGVARFGTGAHAHRVAVLDVTSAEQSLASADEPKQEELLAGRALFLNAQLDDFQLLVRAEPVDLARHLELIQEQARGLPAELAAVARDYIAFLQVLSRQRTLLDRRCYVVLPLAGTTRVQPRLPGALRRLLRGREGQPGTDGLAGDEAVRRLTARSDEAGRQLGRSGLRTRRADGLAYAQLYHRCWAADLARTQRLRQELDDYTTLVVGGSRPALPRGAEREIEERSQRPAYARRLPGRADDPGKQLTRDAWLLALGSRTLADLVAPSGCEVRRDHLRLDGQYARVLAVTTYPRTVAPGWLAPLVESDLPVDVSLHVRPLQSAEMVRALSVQIAKLEASRRARIRGELVPDLEREIALEDAERLRERLQRGEERIFSVSLYILVRGSTRKELDDLTRRVETTLDGMLAQSRRTLWEQERGFRSCLPEGRDQLLVTRNLDTSALAATLPFVGASLSMEHGVLYGISPRTQAPIIIDPFDDSLENHHLVVVAPSGSGKSYFVKLMALRNLIKRIDFLVIDPEDEYRAVAREVGGQVIRLAPSSPHQLNPLDLVLPDAGAEVGGPDRALAEAIATVAARLELLLCADAGPGGAPGTLDVYERAVLARALRETYIRRWQDADGARGGIAPEDPSTHGHPAPLLRDLYQVLTATDGEIARRLALRLERHTATGLFGGPTNVALDRPFVVFQIRDLPKELWPLAIHQIAGFVWSRVRRERRPRRLIVDEAAALLAHPSGGAFLAEVARRARKYYLGLVTITQKVADLTDTEHGDTILTNAAMKLLLKQTSEIVDAADARFRFTAEERQWLLGADKGEGLLLAGGRRRPITIVASPMEHRVATTNPRELAEQPALAAAAIGRGLGDGPSLGATLAARRTVGAGRGTPVAV